MNLPSYSHTIKVPTNDHNVISMHIVSPEKYMYKQYENKTLGAAESYRAALSIQEITNPTKSKYDNVVGWIDLSHCK